SRGMPRRGRRRSGGRTRGGAAEATGRRKPPGAGMARGARAAARSVDRLSSPPTVREARPPSKVVSNAVIPVRMTPFVYAYAVARTRDTGRPGSRGSAPELQRQDAVAQRD